MLVCKKCGYQNIEGNKYCVNYGEILELSEGELKAGVTKERIEKEQKALYVFFMFILFAVIDVLFAYEFPEIMISGLLIDAVICAFIGSYKGESNASL